MNRRGYGSREVSGALDTEVDCAVREAATGHHERSDHGELLAIRGRYLPHLITQGPELLDESRGSVHQDTGVGELWNTTKCSPFFSRIGLSRSVSFSRSFPCFKTRVVSLGSSPAMVRSSRGVYSRSSSLNCCWSMKMTISLCVPAGAFMVSPLGKCGGVTTP